MDTYRSIITDILFQGRRNGFWSGEQAPRFDHGLRQGEKKAILSKKVWSHGSPGPLFRRPCIFYYKVIETVNSISQLVYPFAFIFYFNPLD